MGAFYKDAALYLGASGDFSNLILKTFQISSPCHRMVIRLGLDRAFTGVEGPG